LFFWGLNSEPHIESKNLESSQCGGERPYIQKNKEGITGNFSSECKLENNVFNSLKEKKLSSWSYLSN
jgi:hypothetical protein